MRKPKSTVSKKVKKSSRAVAAMRRAKKNSHSQRSKLSTPRPFSNRDAKSPRNGKSYDPKRGGSMHRQVIVRSVEVTLPASRRKDGTTIRPAMKTTRQVKKIVNHTNNV